MEILFWEQNGFSRRLQQHLAVTSGGVTQGDQLSPMNRWNRRDLNDEKVRLQAGGDIFQWSEAGNGGLTPST